MMTTEEKLVEALAASNAVIEKLAAELDGIKKQAAAVPAPKDYSKEMESRSVGILDLLSRSPLEEFRFAAKDSPMRKAANESLMDPIKAVDALTFAVGLLMNEGGAGNAPKPLGKSAATQPAARNPMTDPSHPDYSYFQDLH